jgi:hypothetical protein
MGFLKNAAIKRVTKKWTRKLIELIEITFDSVEPTELTNLDGRKDDINAVMMSILKDYIAVVEAQGGSLNIRTDEISKWYELFLVIVIQAVRAELSYDPTMGRGRHLAIIGDVVDKELNKWRKRKQIFVN